MLKFLIAKASLHNIQRNVKGMLKFGDASGFKFKKRKHAFVELMQVYLGKEMGTDLHSQNL